MPLPLINAVAAAALIGYALVRAHQYRAFSTLGFSLAFPDGSAIRVPLTRVLVDLTFIVMGVTFLTRRPPIARNGDARQIAVAALGGAFSMLPFLLDGAIMVFAPRWRAAWKPLFMEESPAWWRTMLAIACMAAGNGLAIWSYVVMRRAFSVVPEARELVTRGPFRWLRHPVYTGQILAQSGVWIFLATAHGGWLGFFALFVAVQLYRARAEEGVLSAAFGEAYDAHAARTWWLQAPRLRSGM
ncbi:MAG: isoprenylcysteine carboxylmethyltransferase family protein [Deltaproteobacteria bacterium]|nr:isoprenylcysteine carboxylmethyltransferase family protein [Deltaproteobacteria bacterium]